jgi:hypothetical protein
MQWRHYDVDGHRNYFFEVPRVGVYMIDRDSEHSDWEVSFMAEGEDVAVEIGKADKIYEAQELAQAHLERSDEMKEQLVEQGAPYVPTGDPVMFPMTYLIYNVFGRYSFGDDDPLDALLKRRGSARRVVVVDMYPMELQRLEQTAEDILDDEDSIVAERRAAEALQAQLDDPNYMPVKPKVEHGRYFLNPGYAGEVESKKIGSIGDVNPIEYGGGVVFDTEYGPIIEYTYGLEDESDDANEMDVYQVSVARSVWDDLNWAYEMEIAEVTGIQLRKLVKMGKSKDVMDRVAAYEAAASVYGWHELDQYPVKLTAKELEQRWFEAE